MVVAPEAEKFAAFSVIVATPLASVKAVPAVGVMVARVASVVKVTTELGTTAPAAFLSVAFTVPGAPLVMVVVAAPAASVSASVKVGTGVAGVVPVVPVVPDVPDVPDVPAAPEATGVPPDPPEPQPARAARVNARKSHAENLEISRLNKLWVTRNNFCTQAPFYAIRIDIVLLV